MATAACSLCLKNPDIHCFFQIGVVEGTNVYYACAGRNNELSNVSALIEHIGNVIKPNQPWIWILDCKGMTTKHVMQIDLIKSLLKIFTRPEYRDYVQRFIGINMVPTAQKILDIVLPMLPGDPASGIDKCGSSPLEILACLQRAKLSTDIMRWINKASILDISEKLPCLPS
jgi:hypothetical protein